MKMEIFDWCLRTSIHQEIHEKDKKTSPKWKKIFAIHITKECLFRTDIKKTKNSYKSTEHMHTHKNHVKTEKGHKQVLHTHTPLDPSHQ